jgi:hypothetical protein
MTDGDPTLRRLQLPHGTAKSVRICAEIDDRVNAFLTRPLEGCAMSRHRSDRMAHGPTYGSMPPT